MILGVLSHCDSDRGQFEIRNPLINVFIVVTKKGAKTQADIYTLNCI